MSALFSVVTPAYNRAGLIEETLESVWRQDHRPVEHIVVDDGSSDTTVPVVRDWIAGTPEGTWTSMGVISPGGDQAYGIAEGLMYSFPVTCENGKWKIVQGLPIDERSRALMDATARELAEEKAMAEELIAAM